MRKQTKDFIELDKHSLTGAFTVPCTKKIDMLSLREYCKTEKINYSDLTKKEIKTFER